MQEVKIQDLTDRCIKYFKESCYTESRIFVYKRLWRTGIIRYMNEHDIKCYSLSVGADFLSTCHCQGEVTHQEREKIRSIQVLDEMLQFGSISKSCITPVNHSLFGEIGNEMEKLISHLTNLRRRAKTIRHYRRYLSEFLTHLNMTGVEHVNQITENHILTFVSSHKTNKTNIVSALRILFRFWKDEGIVSDSYEELLDSYKVSQRERIPSYFTASEVLKIESSVSRSNGIGKRNYAMLLLASRLGLRASDIAELQFSNIDWDNDTITLTMKKTGKVIVLPLLADVGNSIIDYLKYGRPKSELQSVFISGKAPYVAASSPMVCSAINGVIRKSGVDIAGKHHGPHSLRHSLASVMLEGGTTIPVISETLGHRKTEVTMTYLKIDVNSLLKCALPVPPVPEEFYTQRGGAFYV